tara:strand:- start:275 stop:607 length:333 start_codon:yes stop_codon:yes gene_type:complete
MSNTIYLVVNNLKGVFDDETISLINQRNVAKVKGFIPFETGLTYEKLRDDYKNLYHPRKGYGYPRIKNGDEYWVFPFEAFESPNPPDTENAVVLTSEELNAFDWDVIEEI